MPENTAAGKVCTGFSLPYVAKYSNSGGTVSYTGGMKLARGVEIDIQPTVADDNPFYADNVQAENVAGVFTGGTMSLTVDGLHSAAERMILGLPEPESLSYGGSKTAKVTGYGDAMNPPYVGFGYIASYMSGGVTTYAPTVLTKVRFDQPGSAHKTQEGTIDWQKQALNARLSRDDSAAHNWKRVAEDVTTEAEAEEILKAMLGIA